MPLHRPALAAAVAAAAPLLALLAGSTAGAVPAAPVAPIPLGGGPDAGGDHLRITVTGAGPGTRTYELHCHPAGGTHPHAQEACDQLDQQTRWGKDLFAPVPKNQMCTMLYGGPERAHVSGTWAGRPVNTDFKRTDGCETARWNKVSKLFGEPFGQSKGSPKKPQAHTRHGW
ncbi:hypothetical protein GCM10010218_24260 [Streptomyces mashuensis]|uniref:Subtilisin inhibitor domain-containing protein n=1 Tax=Streptomyces mashuensis TaxID=33904 RepID=A0A919B230_9ACTN|nr:SSI family serine proteinase inhibitor [Streptomyces mashuensis]GHF42271.1 hypothetical protein GCM10010218_24260 [Streptomyces mashuensis]